MLLYRSPFSRFLTISFMSLKSRPNAAAPSNALLVDFTNPFSTRAFTICGSAEGLLTSSWRPYSPPITTAISGLRYALIQDRLPPHVVSGKLAVVSQTCSCLLTNTTRVPRASRPSHQESAMRNDVAHLAVASSFHPNESQ